MKMKLANAGIYKVTHKGQEFIVRVTGVAPVLSIHKALNLSEFEKSGELVTEVELVAEISKNPDKFLFQPLSVNSILANRETSITDKVEYTTEEFKKWQNLAKYSSYGDLMAIIIKQKDWSFDQAKMVYDQLVK